MAQLWDEEEEMTNLLVIGVAESFVTEDLEIMMEDIFEGIHPEGQQRGATSLTAEREGVEPKVVATEEVIKDRG